MTDIGTGFLRGIEAFLNTRLGDQVEETWKDTGSFLKSLTTFSSAEIKTKFEELKKDISDGIAPLAQAIAEKIKKQTDLIAKMVKESTEDLKKDDFNIDTAARVAVRLCTVLAASDEAYAIIARELAKNSQGDVDETIRKGLMDLWNPWAQPFKDLGSGASTLLDSFGKNVLGIDGLVGELGKRIRLESADGKFLLIAQSPTIDHHSAGAISFDGSSVEAFLQFSDRQIANPTDEEKKSLIEREGKFYAPDLVIFGLRVRSKLQPGLTDDKLLKKLMPGSPDPKTETTTTISLDTAQGLYLGDGRANEKAVLPVRFSFPGVELREVAIGVLREKATRDVTGFELTTSIAARIGKVVGLQVVGAGFIVDMNGVADHHTMFDSLPVTPRWPDAIGLRIDAGPVKGGGFIQRVERTYKVGGQEIKRVEFGGTVQLQIVKVGVTAIVILSPDPFSLVFVIGIRFAKAVELGLGFTLNGIGGLLALNRGFDLDALREGMRNHVIDKTLFPDDPVKEAPALLDQVAKVFPPREGGFVIGPIAEFGWGSEAKFVKLKVGVILALPDPKIAIVGSLVVQVPHAKLAVVDIHAEVLAAVTEDYFLLFATMKGSKIAAFDVSGELGMYIQWSGEGAFEFSVGGFHPEYAKLVGTPPKLGELNRIALDFSPGGRDKNGKIRGPITFTVKAYFAITAGSVQLGVDGRLSADFKVIAARAWLTLDMIFIWSPRFAFKVAIEVGAEVDLFGCTIASVQLRGELEGTRPFSLKGHIKVDVWFLPTFDKDVGPITWGDQPAPELPAADALGIVHQALSQPETWKAILPAHAAQLVTLASVNDVAAVLAHPLAGIEVLQSQIPLGVRITHVGASPVAPDMITIGTPGTTSGGADAVSPLTGSFPPGQFFDLEGEALLSRAGLEPMQGGCRIAMSSLPTHSPQTEQLSVSYRTYIRDEQAPARPSEVSWAFAPFAPAYIAAGVVGRHAQLTGNPYLDMAVTPGVAVADPGASVLTDAVTGRVALDGRELSVTEAALVAEAISAQSAMPVVRTTVRG